MLLVGFKRWLCVFLVDRKYVVGVHQSIGDTHVIGMWSTNPPVSLIHGGLEGFIMGESGQIHLMQGWFEPCTWAFWTLSKLTRRDLVICTILIVTSNKTGTFCQPSNFTRTRNFLYTAAITFGDQTFLIQPFPAKKSPSDDSILHSKSPWKNRPEIKLDRFFVPAFFRVKLAISH